MSENTASIKAQLWQKMRGGKEYRDNFVAAHLSTNVAAQIQTLREDRGWTQRQLGEKAGMTQARISIMEDPNYDKYTFSIMRRLASAFDVAFFARFALFSELAEWTAELSPQKLAVASFDDDSIAGAPAPPPTAITNDASRAIIGTQAPGAYAPQAGYSTTASIQGAIVTTPPSHTWKPVSPETVALSNGTLGSAPIPAMTTALSDTRRGME